MAAERCEPAGAILPLTCRLKPDKRSETNSSEVSGRFPCRGIAAGAAVGAEDAPKFKIHPKGQFQAGKVKSRCLDQRNDQHSSPGEILDKRRTIALFDRARGEKWSEKNGSGAWTRTRITSSKGWRATNCTTPEWFEKCTRNVAVYSCRRKPYVENVSRGAA
jgi:hypothetical protein